MGSSDPDNVTNLVAVRTAFDGARSARSTSPGSIWLDADLSESIRREQDGRAYVWSLTGRTTTSAGALPAERRAPRTPRSLLAGSTRSRR
jgi:hypothetical protein